MLRAKANQFRRDKRGATILVFGLTLPLLLLSISAAVEYISLANRRTALQVAADSAALAGATELSVAGTSDQRIDSVVQSVARAKLDERAGGSSQAAITALVFDDHSAVKVSIAETIPTVMGRLISLVSNDIGARAVGRISGRTRLCLLGLDTQTRGVVHFEKNARVTASGCAIYSNSKDPRGLEGEQNASATASLICSAGGFYGRRPQFTPSPTTDCPVLADPLQSQAAPAVGSCTPANTNKTIAAWAGSLAPGTYCGLTITKGAQVTLQRDGIYVIKDGPLIVEKMSSLIGSNVGFYFTGDKAGLRFDGDTTVSLSAPKTGAMAGILFFEDRNVGNPVPPLAGANLPIPPLVPGEKLREYRIISDDTRMLLGTIYLPVGRLIIDSKKPVADRSAYTVIVARRIELYEGPNLYLNTDYSSTDIPVPNGVGPNAAQVTLAQ